MVNGAIGWMIQNAQKHAEKDRKCNQGNVMIKLRKVVNVRVLKSAKYPAIKERAQVDIWCHHALTTILYGFEYLCIMIGYIKIDINSRTLHATTDDINRINFNYSNDNWINQLRYVRIYPC